MPSLSLFQSPCKHSFCLTSHAQKREMENSQGTSRFKIDFIIFVTSISTTWFAKNVYTGLSTFNAMSLETWLLLVVHNFYYNLFNQDQALRSSQKLVWLGFWVPEPSTFNATPSVVDLGCSCNFDLTCLSTRHFGVLKNVFQRVCKF